MNFYKIILVLLAFPLLLSSTVHKFYVSTTNIEFVEEKQTIQVITKIFTEDVEQALQQRYGASVRLDSKKETEADEGFLKKYVLQKLKINVNGNPVTLQYIGKEYDIDIVKLFFEVEDVSELHSIEIENKVLFDLFSDQKNIIHIKTANRKENLVLDRDRPKGLLNFN